MCKVYHGASEKQKSESSAGPRSENKKEQETIFKLNLWLYGFMLKMVPCIILVGEDH